MSSARASRALCAALWLASGASACEGDGAAPPRDPPPRPAREASSAAPAPAIPTGTAAASAAPTSGAAAPASLAGTWEGRYDARKGTIELPPKVKDKTWVKDDGKAATGAGTVTIEISADGAVKGSGAGALGKSELTGHAEGATVRASVMPVDPSSMPAMSGVLVGMLKGEVIAAELRVAGGSDASIVRESKVELARKK